MKKIHALTIIDKSGSMKPFRGRTIEGINSDITTLKKEVDADTIILNTRLQFSALGSSWGRSTAGDLEKSFVFTHIGKPVQDLIDVTENDYDPDGGTPLLDAIGYGIEKLKEFHKDELGSDDLKIIVTIFTDGEENSSVKWNNDDIKKMIDHFQSDGKWTFTFIGCGSFEAVSKISADYGIKSANTMAYAYTDVGMMSANSSRTTAYSNFVRSAKLGLVDDELFVEKTEAQLKQKAASTPPTTP